MHWFHWLWLIGAFALFGALLRVAHALDAMAAARFGFRPFALPNVLFMAIPNGLLLFAIRDEAAHTEILLALAGVASLAFLLLIRSRTNGWMALVGTLLLLLCAPVLVFSVLFRDLARCPATAETKNDCEGGSR